MDSGEFEDSSKFEGINIINDNKSHSLQIVMDRQSLNEILYEVVGNNEELFLDIKNSSRKRSLAEYKKVYVVKSLSYKYTMK